MQNFKRFATWIQNEAYTDSKPLAELQLQQTKSRILLTIASLTYIILHGEYFEYYKLEALSFAALYFMLNSIALIRLRHRPFTIVGSLAYPILDVMIVSFGMLIDGGHSSGVYFMLLPIIIGNGLRFGNPLLIYAQVSCLVGMLCTTAYGHYTLQLAIDYTLFSWQIFTLFAVPLFAYLIVKKVEKAIDDKNVAEQSSFQLIDKGPLPVFTYELNSKFGIRLLYANAAVYKLFNKTQSDIIGQSTDLLVLPEDSEEMHKFCSSAFREQGHKEPQLPLSTYIRGRDGSGRILKLMVKAIRMRWRDRWIGVCFLLDITERETLQEQLEVVHRHGYMSTLVAGIVHDFRNVLTNMIGNAEVLQMNSDDEAEKQQIETIIAAGERGSDLITHLLKLSRSNRNHDQSRGCTKGEELSLPLGNIIALARLQLPHKVRLISNIREPLPDVAISVVEIEQILLNLINNSMQAIVDSGLIEVEVSGQDTTGKEAFCITVTDNGAGISDENIAMVFKPFWTSRADEGGTGLGLTMIQRIVKLHHGSIDVSSPAGEQKTTVRVCIPPYISEAIKTPAPLTEIEPGSSSTASLSAEIPSQHILVVDDMPDILQIHQAILSRIGHTTTPAESADAALTLFEDKQHQFDLVVTDYRMPGKDGLELVEAIRKTHSTIPILMVTAYGEDEQLQRVGNYGVTLINKPVTLLKLKDGISEAIAQASLLSSD